MNTRLLSGAALGALLCACGETSDEPVTLPVDAGPVVDSSAPVDSGAPVDSYVPPPVDAGPGEPVDDCSGEAKLVYVVDESGMLASFKPDTLTFTDVGKLACESGTPYSMSVDRTGNAWVLYSSGKLYKVSTKTAACTDIARTPNSEGFSTFGMGFVAVDGLSGKDQLFVAGVPPLDLSFNFQTALGVIDADSFATRRIGGLDKDQPELTGTGDGKLWAFFARSTPPALTRLDVTNASTIASHDLNDLGGGSARAYAFAFWGGDFWLFLQNQGEAASKVVQVKGDGFAQSVVIPNAGRNIVGAGVSTCAPLILR